MVKVSFGHVLAIPATVLLMTSVQLMGIETTLAVMLYLQGFFTVVCWDRIFPRKFLNYSSEWYDVKDESERDKFLLLMKTGDIVELKSRSQRSSERAICIGEGEDHGIVLRRSSKFYDISLSTLSRKARGDLEIRINNCGDNFCHPKPVDDIVKCLHLLLRSNGRKTFTVQHGLYKSKDFVAWARYPPRAASHRLDEHHRSPWFRKTDLATYLWLARPWDLVEFDRILYSHYAVCDAVDVDPLYQRSGIDVWHKGPIMQSPIEEIIRGSRFRINNSLDKKYRPRQTESNCKFDLELFNRYFGRYNFFLNNCQRYARHIRYGINFRENFGMLLSDMSKTELIEMIYKGDIIRFQKDTEGADGSDKVPQKVRLKPGFVIYLGMDAEGTHQVAYGCEHCQDAGVGQARVESLDAFFRRVNRDNGYSIFNVADVLDPRCLPFKIETRIKMVTEAVNRKGTCNCCPFQDSSAAFVQEIRNGTEAEMTAEARRTDPPTNLWENIINFNPYYIWHRLTCRDCSTHEIPML